MKHQAPKGTRDFYPEEMAWRRHVEDAWRKISIRNGFEEIDGPIFESLDLYKVKSGDGIISELFHFQDRAGRELAIRPEFTPTLARMVAEKAASLPRPIKWFAVPNFCRAEKPQRGRLREFLQWNVDLIGIDGPAADAEVIFTAVDFLRELGLKPDQVAVKISHRDVVKRVLSRLGVSDDAMLGAFDLLDRRDKIEHEQFNAQAQTLGLDEPTIERFNQVARVRINANAPWHDIQEKIAVPDEDLHDLEALHKQLHAFNIADWCEYDLGIVRGLAYYTGTVFEIHEISGAERAVAGGGRYDRLIEMFGGPTLPAVGFGMGDVVLTNVLEDRGLIPDEVAPPVDIFVVAAETAASPLVTQLISQLRSAGFHARQTYRTTTNVGKLLKEANQSRARFFAVLDQNTIDHQTLTLKNLKSGEQTHIHLNALPVHLKSP